MAGYLANRRRADLSASARAGPHRLGESGKPGVQTGSHAVAVTKPRTEAVNCGSAGVGAAGRSHRTPHGAAGEAGSSAYTPGEMLDQAVIAV